MNGALACALQDPPYGRHLENAKVRKIKNGEKSELTLLTG
jgi:hypothetical protein